MYRIIRLLVLRTAAAAYFRHAKRNCACGDVGRWASPRLADLVTVVGLLTKARRWGASSFDRTARPARCRHLCLTRAGGACCVARTPWHRWNGCWVGAETPKKRP